MGIHFSSGSDRTMGISRNKGERYRRSPRHGALLIVGWMAIGTAACGGATAVSSVAEGPSPVKCPVTLTGPSAAMTAAGGTGTIAVTTQPECAWIAKAEASWILELAPTSGQGSAEVHFQAAPNPDAVARQAMVTVSDHRLQVTQEPAECRFSLAIASTSMGPAGGANTASVTAPKGCRWEVTSSAPWLTFTSGAAGDGNGSVGFRAAANTGGPRTGVLAIGDQTVTITQQGAPTVPSPGPVRPPSPSPQPAPSPDPSPSPIPPPAPAQCDYAIQPATQTVGPEAGAGSPIAVSTGAECAWTAVSNSSWIAVTSGPGGTGNGTATFRVDQNSGGSRSGTLTIGGRTFTVTQSASCSFSIDPTSYSAPASGGSGNTVAVSAPAGCAWTAANAPSWIAVTSGASGTGAGTVTFTVNRNDGGARTASMTVAGQTFTVSQAGACTYSIDPTRLTVDRRGVKDGTVTVTTAAGCSWTAVSSANWIDIKSADRGAGSSVVKFLVDENKGDARTGTMTIAGRTFTVEQSSNGR